MNPMKEIKVEKITLNIGVGSPGNKLDQSAELLERIANAKAVKTMSMKRIPAWGVRPKLLIGCKVTLRKEKAVEVLKKLLSAVNNKVPEKKFDDQGNFSFGIEEYINIPGIEYDQALGIIGLEVAVTLIRPGYRVKRRQIKCNKIPSDHRVNKEEAITFMEKNFSIKVREEAVEA